MNLSPSASVSPLSDNMRGSLLMVAAMAAFALNDALVKFATAEIAPGQVMAVRGFAAFALLTAIAAWKGHLRPLGHAFQGPVLLRAVADVLGTVSYIYALSYLPLANVSAIFQALPLLVTVGAVLFFGERQGWRRWAAIGVGFVGVLVIVRPGTDGFTVYSLAVLVSVLFCAVRDLATRQVPRSMPTLFVACVTAATVTLSGMVMTTVEGWRPMGGATLLALGASALTISVGYVSIVAAMRVGAVGFVAPFRYTILLFAIVLGYLVFAETPSAFDLIGGAIVVTSGLYVIFRERRLGRVAPIKTQVH